MLVVGLKAQIQIEISIWFPFKTLNDHFSVNLEDKILVTDIR